MGDFDSDSRTSLDGKEMNMQMIKKGMGNLVKRAVRAVAMTTVSSTTRYLAYQPKKDAQLAEKYLKRY